MRCRKGSTVLCLCAAMVVVVVLVYVDSLPPHSVRAPSHSGLTKDRLSRQGKYSVYNIDRTGHASPKPPPSKPGQQFDIITLTVSVDTKPKASQEKTQPTNSLQESSTSGNKSLPSVFNYIASKLTAQKRYDMVVQKQQPDVTPTGKQAFNDVERSFISESMHQTTTVYMIPTTTPTKKVLTSHIVLVVSYMRSGSTFTGDIMQHFPNSLYVFEPFHKVVYRVNNDIPLRYINGTVREITKDMKTDGFLKEELHKWLQCRLDELDVDTLLDRFHFVFSRSMRRLNACMKPMGNITTRTLRKCLPSLIEFCMQAKMRLFKFIRLPMSIVRDVFETYPNLQVIHLVRDPRGTLISQRKYTVPANRNLTKIRSDHCSRTVQDLESTAYLHDNYPERAKILIYEKLAANPLAVAKKLFEFIGKPVLKYTMKYIEKITSSGRELRKPCSMCIRKNNSLESGYKWKHTISSRDMRLIEIDSSCRIVYDFLGYRRFSSVVDLAKASSTVTPSNMSIFI